MLDHGALDTGSVNEAHARRHAMRHSAAHVMADAVLKLFPEAKMGIGPPTQDGFYYDFDVSALSLPKTWSGSRPLCGNPSRESFLLSERN